MVAHNANRLPDAHTATIAMERLKTPQSDQPRSRSDYNAESRAQRRPSAAPPREARAGWAWRMVS